MSGTEAASAASFTCPCCGAVSRNPNDIAQRYCGRCHWWTGDPGIGAPHLADECPHRRSPHVTDPLESDPLFREFAGDTAVRMNRLETMGMMPEAVCLRADLWPLITEWNGYPVVRLAASSSKLWGVLA